MKSTWLDLVVVLLDEVDKLGRDPIRGDPTSALLEVLDPEQNAHFQDHYLGVPFDLSQVVFIATANTLETIPPPLLDRMEIITMSGYTYEEKLHIARSYLLPKQLNLHGLADHPFIIDDTTLLHIATGYTREPGNTIELFPFLISFKESAIWNAKLRHCAVTQRS